MGTLVKGNWLKDDTIIKNGAFVRPDSPFRGAQSPAVLTALVSVPGRYHLIVSRSCQWSHFTTIIRKLKNLTETVRVHFAGGPRTEGYAVSGGADWPVPGGRARIRHLHELYTLTNNQFTGRATVPVLWDSHAQKIVSNESTDIGRAFDSVRGVNDGQDFIFAPPELRGTIEVANGKIYNGLNNAVYQAGFARSQEAYEEAVELVFATMDGLEARLSKTRYYFGAAVTETDWRIFTTLCRFDSIYYILFKCSRRRLVDYPNLWAYARDLYQIKGIAETIDFDAMREGSYLNDHCSQYPIIAVAPEIDWEAPHGRETLSPAMLFLKNSGPVKVDLATLKASKGAEV